MIDVAGAVVGQPSAPTPAPAPDPELPPAMRDPTSPELRGVWPEAVLRGWYKPGDACDLVLLDMITPFESQSIGPWLRDRLV